MSSNTNENISVNFQALGADKFANDVEKSATALDKQSEALDKSTTALDKEKQSVKTTTSEVDKHTDSTGKNEIALRKQLNALEAQRVALQKEVQALKDSNNASIDRIDALQRQIQQDKFAEASLRARIQAMKDEAKAAKEASGYVQQGVQDVSASIRNALSITALIGGITAGLVSVGAAIQQYGQFERTLNTIKAVAQATDSEVQAIKESSLDLGAKTVFTNQEVADSYLNLSKAGLTVQESLAAMPGVLDAAAASGEGLSATTDVVIGTLRGFGLQASETTRVADVLAQAANTSSADIGDIGQAMKQLAPVAAQASQSLEDMGAVTAALADHMIKGGDAGSDLRAILLRLINPPSDASKAIKTLGLSITDAQGRVKPLIDIILQLQSVLKKYDQKSQLTLIGDIAGLENVKSLSTLVSIGSEKLKEYQASLHDADGAAKRMADTINQGVNTAFEQFQGSVEAAGTSLGEGFAPAIVNILTRLTSLVNMVAENSSAFSDFTQEAVKLVSEFSILLGPLGSVLDAFKSLTDSISRTTGISASFGNALTFIAGAMDIVTTSAEKTRLAIARTGETFKNVISSVGNTSKFAALQNTTDTKFDKALSDLDAGFKARNQQRQERTSGNLKQTVSDALKAQNVNNNNGTGSKTYSSGSKKKKRGKSQATLEKDQVSDVLRDLSDFNSSLDASYSLGIANLGAFPTQVEEFGKQAKKLKAEQEELAVTEAKLNSLSPKTKEGLDAKTEALKKVTTETKKNQAATQDLQNRIEQFNKIQRDRQNDFLRNAQTSAMDFEFNQLKDHIEQIKKDQDQLYADGAISAEQYYGTLKENSAYLYSVEKDQIEQQLATNQQQMDNLNEQEIEQGKLIELSTQRLALENKLATATRQQADEQENLTNAYVQANLAFSKNLKSQTQQALEQAISNAFTGNGILSSLQQFGQAFRKVLADSLGQALAKYFTNSLGNSGFFQKLFPSIQGGTVNASSLASLVTNPGVLALVGAAIAQKGSSIAGNAKGTLGQAGGVGLGIGGGALAGAAIGSIVPGVGTLIGAGVGAAVGGAASVNSTQRTGAIGRNKDAIIGGLLFGVGGALVGHLFDNKANKQADWARNDAANQQIANSILSQADQNNLDDLNAKIRSLSALWQKQNKNHQGGKQPLRDAISQLQDLVKQRQKVIDDEIKSLKDDATGLQFQLDTFGKTDIEKAAAQYKYDLQTLQNDTQALLDQFKDSEEAKTQILANESLKRQLLEKQTQQTYKDSAQQLSDLFAQRDQISNQNVFTRAQTAEQKKAADLSSIDQQIAQALQSVSDLSQLGFAAPNIAGINQLLGAAQQASQQNNTLTFLINGATDPNAVTDAIKREMTAFFKKNFGATV